MPGFFHLLVSRGAGAWRLSLGGQGETLLPCSAHVPALLSPLTGAAIA